MLNSAVYACPTVFASGGLFSAAVCGGMSACWCEDIAFSNFCTDEAFRFGCAARAGTASCPMPHGPDCDSGAC